MKTLIPISIIMFVFLACNRDAGSQSSQQKELADTLKFRRIVLQVEGMTCTGCETTISKTVGKLPGIKSVEASHLDSVAIIVFDTSMANVVVISESINGLGYKV